ncbi:hypothetical protein [Eilatimonas milleporae]|uniref:Uncharacterized protein n=1 Tax=Eilatimonas milleporae TaxID=911205 RepID=A0A3M0BX57_9PROT|nr:hypothetical protein [Eilatimonas milleporae]RMB02008.1 hypothetical protein BXY39_3518 [Eilatimonas milleporae]
MVSGSSKSPRDRRAGRKPDNLALRELSGGAIRHVIHDAGDTISASDAPEIVLRIAGRGKIGWPEAPTKDRSGAAIFVPPGQTLTILGKVRALRVALPGLEVTASMGPLSDALISLLIPRAWHAPEPIAQAAFTLVCLLVEEDLQQRGRPQRERSPLR